jgi:hypothetical protein
MREERARQYAEHHNDTKYTEELAPQAGPSASRLAFISAVVFSVPAWTRHIELLFISPVHIDISVEKGG